LATLELFEHTDAINANRATAAQLAAQFEGLSTHPRVQHARQCGLIFAWDVPNHLPDFARRFARHALAQGVVLRPIGHTVYAMPPYVINEAEGEHLARGALAALQATLNDEPAAPTAALSQGEIRDGV
jgi:adenosylmethionine-8-amino-7-oxononanoate aminotransferase